MTKKILIVCMALAWTVSLMAQKITVVSPSGATQLFSTLAEAVEGATDGSVIYLPGGYIDFGSVTINKKLTIFGIGHKTKTDNPDGLTHLGGTLYFASGSDGSALMGCLVSTVYIGVNTSSGYEVNDVLIRHNNISYVYLYNTIRGTTISQNYIRGSITNNNGRTYDVHVTNNAIGSAVNGLYDSFIDNNIFTCPSSSSAPLINSCYRTSITKNIFVTTGYTCSLANDCSASGNMAASDIGDDCINVGGEGFSWNDVFVKFGNISQSSTNMNDVDFHFKGEYAQYADKVGIYAGSGFSDDQLAPIPYIVSKRIDEQTDAAGKLNIKVRVKAGE